MGRVRVSRADLRVGFGYEKTRHEPNPLPFLDLRGFVPSNYTRIYRSQNYNQALVEHSCCIKIITEGNLWVRSQSHKQSSLCWCKSKKRGSLWIRSLHVVVLVSYYIIVKTDCKNNSLRVDLFTMRIAMSNPLQVFILKRFISPVFLGHHIVCYLLFRIFAWYDLLLFNLDLNN